MGKLCGADTGSVSHLARELAREEPNYFLAW